MPSLDFETEKVAFREFYNDNGQRLEQAKNAFLTLLMSLLTSGGVVVASATSRLKDREEAIKKFARKYQTGLEAAEQPYEIRAHVTDLIGARIVCLYEDEIERVSRLMREHFETIDVTDKTAQIEGTDNSFGYKGLHLDLRLKPERAAMAEYAPYAEFQFELQIRTIIQDSWSTLDHEIKYKKSIPPTLRRRINTLAALFELADREFRQIREETEREIRKADAETDPAADPDMAAGHGEPTVAGEGDATPDMSEDPARTKGSPPLDAFRLRRIASHYFPENRFEENKLDGFTAEIAKRDPGITTKRFNALMRDNVSSVRRYRQHFLTTGLGERFNPFTEMRHALYAGDGDLFGDMLNKEARSNFDAWLAREAAPSSSA